MRDAGDRVRRRLRPGTRPRAVAANARHQLPGWRSTAVRADRGAMLDPGRDGATADAPGLLQRLRGLQKARLQPEPIQRDTGAVTSQRGVGGSSSQACKELRNAGSDGAQSKKHDGDRGAGASFPESTGLHLSTRGMPMSVVYDEKVLVNFAERLYRRASSTVMLYAVVAGAFGAAVVGIGGALASRNDHDWAFPNVLTLIFAGFSAYVGARVGSDRAFTLRFMAQTALCQV